MMYRSSIVAFMAFAAVAAFASNVTVGLYAIGDTKGASSLSPSSMTLTVGQAPAATLQQLSGVSRTGYTLATNEWKASFYVSPETYRVFDAAWCAINAKIDVLNAQPQSGWTMLVVPVTPNPYTVVFNANGGSGTMNPQSFTYDEAKALTLNSFTKVGHAFSGWNYGGYTYADGEVVSNLTTVAGREVTFTAVWSANTYTITLDAGEADTPGTASVQATYGSAFPSPITLPTRFGYRFKGYYTQEEGAGDPCYLANGNPCTSSLSSNATIYAWWEQIPVYNVTFRALGGTFSNGWTTSTNYTEGVGLTLPTKNDITRDNKDFGGWYEADDTEYLNRVSSITSSDRGDKIYKARWLDKSYTVEFKSNGGSGNGTQTFTMGESRALKAVADMHFRRTGYSFKEWSRNADGSGDRYANGAIIDDNLTDVADDVVFLYAQWAPNPYEVAFNANGADGGETMANQSFVYDATQHLDAVEFTYTGHAFRDWSSDTNYNYQTKYYADGAEVVNLALDGVVNLYANWTGIVYTVTFDANGAGGVMNPLPCTYGVPTNLPACAFTRNGYGFKGWTTNGVDGVLFNDRARVTNLTATAGAEVPLIACWTGVTYAVTLDARDWRGDGMMTNRTGETVSVLTNLYTVGDNWILPVPTNARPHLAFAGWKDNWGRMVDDGVQVPLDSEGVTNLVAVWSDSLAPAVDAPRMDFASFGTEGLFGYPNESPFPAAWFAQTNFVYGGTNAAQSGALPANTGDGLLYVSWLTTKVEGKGVLSFWWKCDAQPLVEDSRQPATGGWVGDFFRFGLYDSVNGITDEVARLTDHVDWCYVAYTNKSDSAVSLAWAFVYADYNKNNGGGTGWVDRVTWTPEGSVGELSYISISGDEHVSSDGSAVYTCTAMMSDGSMKSVTPTWSIESGASDAGIDSSGVLTAHATDVLRTVTVKASYTEGDVTVTATKTVAIVPLSTYTVTFDSNSGAGTMGSLTCICNVETNLPACTFTRDGWGFAGWATNRTGSVQFADGARVLNLVTEGSVALYACWTGVTYAVTLDANGGVLANGSGEPVEELAISVTVGGVWNLPVPTRTDTSFVFGGWTYGEGQKVNNGEEVTPPSAGITNLLAAWTKADPLAIAVEAPELGFKTFATFGDYGRPKEDSYEADWFVQSVVVSNSASALQSGQLPVNSEDGLVYVSWLTTTVQGKGVLSFWWKCDAQPLVENSYQQATGGWVGDLFRFGLYDSENGITDEVARLTDHVDWCYVAYTNKSDSAVSLAWAFVYADYNKNNGGGTGWVDHVTWTPEGATQPDDPQPPASKYTVTFDANGGDGGWTEDRDYGSAIDAPEVTWTGHTFVSWEPAVDATVPASNVTYVAQWTTNTYTVTFDANGGDGGWSEGRDYGSAIDTPEVTWTGHTFAGWVPAVDATVPASNVTYVAQWTINQYTVTISLNGGEGESSVTVEYGTKVGDIAEPTRTGYTFAGWFTAAEGGDPVDGETLVTGDMELHAQWTPNQYTIAFDSNGGEGEMAILTNTYDLVSCLTSNAFTCAGHSFDGWATNATDEAVYADGEAVSNLTAEANGTVTLYAHWKEDETPPDDPPTVTTYTITFKANANGVEGEMPDQTFTNGIVSCLASNAFTYADHVFAGWATNETGEAIFADGAEVSNLTEVDGGVVTLYAVWQELSPVEHTLTVGEYFYVKLQDLGYPVPTDGTPYDVVAEGLPAGLKLKYNAAVEKKVNGKTVVVQKEKTEWWIEGVPTAALDFFTNPPYLVITSNGVAETYALPLEVEAQKVTVLEDLALGQPVNEQFYLPGVTNGWTVSGLPTGLKYAAKKVTKKSGKKTVTVAEAYAVYGKTTKAGLFTVTAKKKHGAYYETMKYRVLVRPNENFDKTLFGEDLKNITTMAYVPFEWNLTNDVSSVGGKVARVTGLPTGLAFAATTTYKDKKKTQVKQYGQVIKGTPTKPGTYVVTFTKNVKSGKATVAKTAQILWKVVANDVEVNLGFNEAGGVIESGVVGLKYGDLLAFSATEGATVTTSGLPSGITLTKLDDGSYAFTGFTTKAGTYLVTVRATLRGRSVTQRLLLKVEGLPAWAKGTFNGVVYTTGGTPVVPVNGQDARSPSAGLATITVSSVGKISGKFYEGGTNWTISAASYTSATSAAAPAGGVSAGDAFMCSNVEAKYTYKVTKTVNGKKKTVTQDVKRTFTLAVSPVPVAPDDPDNLDNPVRGVVRMEEVRLAEDGSPNQDDGATAIDAWQNVWGRADYKALGKKLFLSKSGKMTLAYTTFLRDVYTNEVGQAYFLKKGDDTTGLTYLLGLSLKVTTAGTVTATLSYDTGKTKKDPKTKKTVKVIYKATCQSVLVPQAAADAESFVGAVPLYFAPSAGNNFKGFAEKVDYPFDGRSVSEQEP